MFKNKFFIKMFLVVTLSGLFMTTTQFQAPIMAKSVPNFNSSYWWKKRKMRVRKTTYAYLIKNTYYNHNIKRVKLHPNTRVRLANTANLAWVVTSSKLLRPKSSRYSWVVKRFNTAWLKY